MATVNRFDARAKDWDNDPAKVQRALVVANAIRKAVKLEPDMHALEYGCGTGLLSFALQNEFASITLADTSRGMLEVLSEKIAHYNVPNMQALLVGENFDSLPGRPFNVVYSLLTLHHIPDTAGALTFFSSQLKQGGFLCIADLEQEDGSFHGPDVNDVHKGFDREELTEMATSAGFSEVRFTPAFSVVKPVKGVETSFPVFLMTASKQ